MLPLLRSVYYNPRIFSNHVSSWWNAASDVIKEIFDDKVLARVMSKQQPRTAALWLGAIIIGKHHYLDKLFEARPFADVVAAAWTDLSLLFITLPCSGDDMGNMISRADECRPLMTTDRSRPPSPWPPCGAILTEGLEPDVRKYSRHSGLHLQYRGWEWRDGIGKTNRPGVMRDTTEKAATSSESSATSSELPILRGNLAQSAITTKCIASRHRLSLVGLALKVSINTIVGLRRILGSIWNLMMMMMMMTRTRTRVRRKTYFCPLRRGYRTWTLKHLSTTSHESSLT